MLPRGGSLSTFPHVDEALWDEVQRMLPIACVDVLPVLLSADGRVEGIGLIRREVPSSVPKWCLIGGRLGHGETMLECVSRQVGAALGGSVVASVLGQGQPLHVAEYGPWGAPRFGREPRKKALAPTFAVTLRGPIRAMGEAIRFSWFERGQAPPRSEVGFDQDLTVDRCLLGLGADPDPGWWR